MDYRSFISESLKKAAHISTSFFGKVKGSSKPGDQNQVLTQADVEIGKLLIERIGHEFPTHNIIDEETGGIDKKSEFTWVIDPIDGTSNFANGVPTYGIMLGLLKNSQPIAGGVALPYFKELYIAQKDEGAYCNGRKITVTSEQNLETILFAFGIDGDRTHPDITQKQSSLFTNLVNQVRNIRTSHSVFDLMQVATGGYGGLIDINSYKIWDNVAAHIIIEEAGGVYTDIYGKSQDYSQALEKLDKWYSVCTAAPQFHSRLLKIIQEHYLVK